MPFEFATAAEVVFGRGSFASLAGRVAPLGRRALVITGSDPSRSGVLERLEEAGVEATPFQVISEPTTEVARDGVARGRAADCDVVVGVGGGSVLDGAKAIAPLLRNEGEPLDYLEVIGAGRKLERPPAPFVAVPTTSGTGSEVTRNAVLASPEHKVKVSGSRTEIFIGGKSSSRGKLKPGMACEIAYLGNGNEARKVSCK